MRRILLGLFVCAIAFPASAAARPVYFPARCDGPLARPHSILVDCGDGSFFVRRLHWRDWGSGHAHSSGVAHVRSSPQARFRFYRVRVTLSRASVCPNTGIVSYHRLTIRFTGKRKPRGYHRTYAQRVPCG